MLVETSHHVGPTVYGSGRLILWEIGHVVRTEPANAVFVDGMGFRIQISDILVRSWWWGQKGFKVVH